MKIGICSFAVGETYKTAVLPSQLSKIQYCQNNNYDYIDDTTIINKNYPVAWSKILLLLKYLSSYDYLVWIDADAMVMGQFQKIEDKIHRLMHDKDFLLQKVYPNINTGVIFVKNTEYSHAFLTRWFSYANTKKEQSDWDQDVLIKMYNDNELEIQKHMQVLSYEYEKEIQSLWYVFHPDHFILHICGTRDRHEKLGETLRKFCPIKLPDDTTEKYIQRLVFIENCREYINKCIQSGGFLD